ncbi:MAG: hypothetical protein IPJ60_07590 [Sphingobacteriaceae bacterium]|nr:hypothetical protein [Sphingobacteriaceae bacterium]
MKNGLITSIAFDEQNNLYVGRRNLEKNSFLKITPPYGSNNIGTVWNDGKFEKGITIRVFNETEFVFPTLDIVQQQKNFR